MRDASTGTSRGFGFVSFASSFMTEAAMDKAPFEICGAKIQPKRASPDKIRLYLIILHDIVAKKEMIVTLSILG